MIEKHGIWGSLLYAETERANSLESLCMTINFETTNTIVSMDWLKLSQVLMSSLCFSFPSYPWYKSCHIPLRPALYSICILCWVGWHYAGQYSTDVMFLHCRHIWCTILTFHELAYSGGSYKIDFVQNILCTLPVSQCSSPMCTSQIYYWLSG